MPNKIAKSISSGYVYHCSTAPQKVLFLKESSLDINLFVSNVFVRQIYTKSFFVDNETWFSGTVF